MFYNRIKGVWVFDLLDIFIVSAIIGSFIAARLKSYLSEKESMKRLKESIIAQSDLVESRAPILNFKEDRIKRIYKFALTNRGGQDENWQRENEAFIIAQQIEKIVTRLAAFLKERELKGILKILFRQGRLVLELILYKCSIKLTYLALTEGSSTQLVVMTVTAGGAAGFTLSWLSAGISLVAVPTLISAFLLRSFNQQILHNRDYLEFKKLFNKLIKDDDIKKTIQISFVEGEDSIYSPRRLKMGLPDLDQNPSLKHDFSLKSGEDFEKFIKNKINEDLGLVENPTEKQLKEMVQGKISRRPRPKGRTVYFRDLVEKWCDEAADLSDSDIIDVEIIEEAIRDDELFRARHLT